MSRYRVVMSAVACLALSAAVLLAPTVASAAGPAESRTVIREEGFETLPFRSDLTVEPVVLGVTPAAAYWGRITQRVRSGAYGLWCAGTVVADPIASGWTTFGGHYPNSTFGVADFDLPQLADYFSAELRYWYFMPSLGGEDYFQVNWDGIPETGDPDVHERALQSTWSQETWDLSAPSNSRNLSRKPGMARFAFIQPYPGSTGEGPTIDDVLISGYRYGPVRSLAATAPAGQVSLSWTVPWRSTEATMPEERPVAYRVWRSLDAVPYVWTELTSSRIATTTFDDTSTTDGFYRYAVQAWDTGVGTGYGEMRTVAYTLGTPAPVAQADAVAFTGSSFGAAAPGVLANDAAGGTSLTAVLESGPSVGTLALRADGSYDYTPPAGFSGTVTFTYRASSTLYGLSAPAMVTITVTAPPVTPPTGPLATSITIKTNATTSRIGGIPILSGSVSPNSGLVGKIIVVYVKKAGKSYWTYSSNRVVYSLYGNAVWQYKYYFKKGMAKGIYTYKAFVPTYTGFVASTSPTTVSIRVK
jgi:hypothetical protein